MSLIVHYEVAVLLAACSLKCWWLVPTEFRTDYTVRMKAVRCNCFRLKRMPLELRADRAMVLEAVKCHGYCMQYANGFWQDRELVLLSART